MQLTPQKGNIIEKILRDANGQLVRATFCVYEDHGRFKARLLKAEVLEQKALENKILALGTSLVPTLSHTKVQFAHNIVSPFFTTSLLHTSGSKPRAPTF